MHVTYLQRNEQSDCFHRIISSVDVIPHEEVICIGRFATDAKQLHKIVELAVDIATHCHRTLDILNICFLRENLLRLNI